MFARGVSLLLGVGAVGVLALALILQAGAGPPEASAQGASATATAAATPLPLPECLNGTAVANPLGNAGLVSDCSVLLRAKVALQGTATLNWSATLAIASWDGVGLTESDPKRVGSLRSGGKALNGSIPPGLGRLNELTLVDWVGLGLTGTIPAELGNLGSLTSLKLSGNKLSGEIPASLGNLTSLETMYLGGNDLTGPIPDLSRITPLHVLILRNNELSGEIPAWLGGMTNLKRLILSGNRLTGDIPHELGRLPDGRMGLAGGDGEIRLSGNALSGCVPPSLRTVPIHDLALLPLSDCPLPTKPADLAAASGDGNAVLSWTDPGGEGLARVTGYRYRIGPAAAWRELVCDGVVVAGIRAHGLTNGTEHTLALQARNVYGWGPPATVEVTPAAPAAATVAPAAAPPKPSGVTAAGGDGRVALSWTTPAAGAGTQYRYRLRAPDEAWGDWRDNGCTRAAVGGATGGMTLIGLEGGATYEVRLQAYNAAGRGEYEQFAATTAPAAPDGLGATDGNGNAVLSWTDPDGKGDARVTGYRYRTGPAAGWIERVCDGVVSVGMQVRGLTGGTVYALELQARNAEGWGPSAEVTVRPLPVPTGTVAPTAKPPEPSGLEAEGGDRRIALSWDEPDAIADGQWIRYRYSLRPAGGTWGDWLVNDCTREATDGMTLTGLDAGVTYEVRLQARNSVGWGRAARDTATTVPGPPAGLAAEAGRRSALLTWDDLGPRITGYRYRTGPGADWSELVHTYADAIAAIRVRGLSNGKTYTLELQAQNASGWGPSATAAVTPTATPPEGATTTP